MVVNIIISTKKWDACVKMTDTNGKINMSVNPSVNPIDS